MWQTIVVVSLVVVAVAGAAALVLAGTRLLAAPVDPDQDRDD